MGGERDSDRIIAELATRQRGVVARSQLRRAGLSDRQIDRRIATGRLHQVHRGIYLAGHRIPPALAIETAALLAYGPRAALSHQTAASVWELLAVSARIVHVTVDGNRRRHRGTAVHRAQLGDEVTTRHGLRVTTVGRTLLDLRRSLSEADLEQAVANAHRRRLVDIDDLSRRATGSLATILDRGARFTRSDGEQRLLALCRAHGLPLPETNVMIAGWEVDALWRAAGLVVEIDGATFHHTPADVNRDRAKEAALDAAGLRVVRFSWRQVRHEAQRVATRIRRSLSRSPPHGWRT